jgi:hypothetical protein
MLRKRGEVGSAGTDQQAERIVGKQTCLSMLYLDPTGIETGQQDNGIARSDREWN